MYLGKLPYCSSNIASLILSLRERGVGVTRTWTRARAVIGHRASLASCVEADILSIFCS